jgi:hypothetical protein
MASRFTPQNCEEGHVRIAGGIGPAEALCTLPHQAKCARGPQKEKAMKTRFLTITIAAALASVFAVQPATAKSSHKSAKTTSANKKHHKKHQKKTASLAAPVANAAPVVS